MQLSEDRILYRNWDRLWHPFLGLLVCTDFRDVPSGYVKIAIENGHLEWILPLKMVIFHSYVSLPESRQCRHAKVPFLRKKLSMQRICAAVSQQSDSL